MPLAPALPVGNVHLIAQHVPDDPRFNPIVESLFNRAAIQRGQLLIARYATAITAAENLVEKLPKLTLTHTVSLRYGASQLGSKFFDRVQIVGNHAQHLRRAKTESLGNRAKQLRTRLFLPTLYLGQITK